MIDDHLVPLKQATLTIADTLAQLPDFDLRQVLGRGLQFVPFAEAERLPAFDLHAVLRAIVEQTRTVVHAAIGILTLAPAPGAHWQDMVCSGMSPDVATALVETPGLRAALVRVASAGRVTCMRHLRQEADFHGVAEAPIPLESLLSVGIYYQSRQIGTLFLINKDHHAAFTTADEQAVELLAAHAAIAIQQSYLFASLEAQRAQLHVILESVRDGILFVVADSRRIIANAAASHLFGMPLVPEAGESQLVGLLCSPEGLPLRQEDLPAERAFQGDHRESQELLIHRPDGSTIPVQVQSAPVQAGTGTAAGMVVVYQDITATKREERLRKEYVALTSHDLRTPLTVIQLQAQLAKQLLTAPTIDRDRITRTLESVERNSRHLNGLIQEMLDVTQLEAGEMELHRQPTDLRALVSASIDQAVPPDQRSRIQLVAAEGLPLVAVDPEKIARVVINLLANAVKYATPGTPVDVRLAGGDGHVTVATTNAGRGIDPQNLDHLFHKFYRAKTDDRIEGRGLGLYISRLIIEAHHGRIWAASDPDRGTTVSFSLPVSGQGRP